MNYCCVCKKQALIMPYVCPECLERVTGTSLKDEITRLNEIIDKAIYALRKGMLLDEARTIEIMRGGREK